MNFINKYEEVRNYHLLCAHIQFFNTEIIPLKTLKFHLIKIKLKDFSVAKKKKRQTNTKHKACLQANIT